MRSNILYWGLFIKHPYSSSLQRPIEYQHITFGFKTNPPDDVDWEKLSNEPVDIIGYGNDGENEALEVRLSDTLEEIYQGAYPVHITLSLSEKGRAVNSKNLDFEPFDETLDNDNLEFGYMDYQNCYHPFVSE